MLNRKKNPGTTEKNSSAVEVLDELLRKAIEAGASDLHLHRINNQTTVAMRLDGVLQKVSELELKNSEHLFGRIKYLAKLKTYQDNFPQDGRIPGKDVNLSTDIRVSTYPAINGEKIVLRFFSHRSVTGLKELGFSPDAQASILSFLKKPSGMMLLTGPAGSGKTTTIYACLLELAGSGERNIVTIEDPVENEIPGIMQTEINEAIGLDFPKALRHLLRQDPEVIVIGEIRDEETAKIAVRSAFTGHMVIATLHAGSCRGVVERLFDMCDDRYAVLSSVDLIMNQRLLRKKCPDCQGKDCEKCLGSSYSGRIPVADFLEVDDNFGCEIRETGPEIIKDRLKEQAMKLVKQGLTDENEIKRMLG